jgi:YidC/Oxa1 family membrane protein insertase
VPVFIGLFHVLREFEPGKTENYVFGASEVASFNAASLFGAKLGAWVTQGAEELARLGTSIPSMLIVMIPLMIAAGVFTHITARHSVARQTEAQLENPQAVIMNKMMLYVFPIGVVVGAPFLPLAVLLYWVANNLWTLGQQYVVYRKIDAEEADKKAQVAVERQARAPRPGQKPVRPEVAPAHDTAPDTAPAAPEKRPGAKPVTKRSGSSAKSSDAVKAPTAKASTNGAVRQSANSTTRPGARRPRKRR